MRSRSPLLAFLTPLFLSASLMGCVAESSDTSDDASDLGVAQEAVSPAGSLAVARTNHASAPLPNGSVLVAGGSSGAGFLSSAEIYDPATNAWSPAASLGTARMDAAAVPLPGGKVLVAGGTSGTFLSSVEIYDPTTNAWSLAAPMSVARTRFTVTIPVA